MIGLCFILKYFLFSSGIEGKAGMAAIVDHDDSVDMNELYTEFDTALPHYARPVFIRLLKSSQADITSMNCVYIFLLYKITLDKMRKIKYKINTTGYT